LARAAEKLRGQYNCVEAMIMICMQSDSPINMIITNYATTFLFMYYTAFVSYSLLYIILWCMSAVSVCV